MASEVLSAVTDPLTLNGSTAFVAGALTHTTRALTLHVGGILSAQKSGGRMYKDTAIIDYTLDGGGSWNLIANFNGEEGGVTFNQTFGPIDVSASTALAKILVRVRTTVQVPDPTFEVDTIKLTCTDAGLPATKVYAHCDLFGF